MTIKLYVLIVLMTMLMLLIRYLKKKYLQKRSEELKENFEFRFDNIIQTFKNNPLPLNNLEPNLLKKHKHESNSYIIQLKDRNMKDSEKYSLPRAIVIFHKGDFEGYMLANHLIFDLTSTFAASPQISGNQSGIKYVMYEDGSFIRSVAALPDMEFLEDANEYSEIYIDSRLSAEKKQKIREKYKGKHIIMYLESKGGSFI